jgi:hypothetical protein
MSHNGRPTKYNLTWSNKLIEFFDVDLIKGNGMRREANAMPTFEGFCFKNKIHHSTLLDWCDKHEEFSEAYAWCKNKQKEMIIQGGMLGLYNAQFTIFVAKNVTDMKDKTEIVSMTNEDTQKLLEEARAIIETLGKK